MNMVKAEASNKYSFLPNVSDTGPRVGFCLSCMALVAFTLGPSIASADGDPLTDILSVVTFTNKFFYGKEAVDVSRFSSGNPISEGNYSVDLFVNGLWIGRENVFFRALDDKQSAKPCFVIQQLEKMAVNIEKLPIRDPKSTDCRAIDEWVPDAFAGFDSTDLRLDLSLPNISMRRSARGYVDPKYWDRGITAAVLGYDFNTYEMRSDGSDNKSSYLGLNSGLNVGDWQLRHVSSMTWQGGLGHQWQKIATYAQRNIAPWSSKLTVGETSTNGELFDSVRFQGMQLATDDRMLPDSLRGYAPVVRGVASTNALVEIRQNGVLIYHAPVAAGPFEFNDLYSTGYGGDLNVSVTEADGRVHRFSVPYASVAQLLRAGNYRYNVTIGQIDERFLHDKPKLFQATLQRGFNNLFTGYGGIVASDGYGAAQLGGAFNTSYGALSLDLTHARTAIPSEETESGQSVKLGYSKLLSESGTNLSVAAYRYSTSSYLSLRDALNQREFATNRRLDLIDFVPARDSLDGPLDLRLSQQTRDFAQQQALRRQRNSFQMTLTQPLGDYGSVSISGFKRNYWAGDGDTQYQISYYNHWKSLGYSASIMRSKDLIGRSNSEYYLSFSLPLGSERHSPSLRSTITRNDRGYTNSQLGLSGTAGTDSNFDYGVTTSHDTRHEVGSNGSANVQYRSPVATMRGSYGQGSRYKQASVGISGAMVAHSDGLTLSPQLGETMALVRADAAHGARVVNSSGVRVDRNGYAVIPYLNPYSSNTIELDPQGLADDVELQNSSQQIAPFAGAVVKVQFATVEGRAVLIHALGSQGNTLPFAADVLNAQGLRVGMVSQGSRLYVRGVPDSGQLTVKWGDGVGQRCHVNYQLPPLNENKKTSQQLQTVKAKCLPTSERIY